MQKVSKIKKSILYMLKKYLECKADIEIEQNDTELIKPPYLILPNHSNNMDPFLVNIYVNRPIQYVTSDEYFRNFITHHLLKYTGAIPKRKFVRDTAVIKEIINRVKDNRIIGIFPEGRRNWDGTTEEIIYSTAKLIKLLKIPVIIATLKGAYLSYPRWAAHSRWGKINISYKLVLTEKQTKKIPLEEIYDLLQNEFNYNEYDYQKINMNIYSGKKLAENLETLLFTCPRCSAIGKMKSKDNTFYCTSCNYTIFYNKYGYFENKDKVVIHENLRDWNQWQLGILKKLIEKNDLQMYDQNIELIKLNKQKKLKKVDTGALVSNSKDFRFKGKNNLLFELDKISGLNIQYNNILEFYYDKELYRFVFSDRKTSAYKWIKSLQYMKISK